MHPRKPCRQCGKDLEGFPVGSYKADLSMKAQALYRFVCPSDHDEWEELLPRKPVPIDPGH